MSANDCLQCGACCQMLIIEEIYDVDLVREPLLRPHVRELRKEPGRYMMAWPCPFLTRGAKGRAACRIYPTRPTICVAFAPGSNEVCPRHTEALEEMEASHESQTV